MERILKRGLVVSLFFAVSACGGNDGRDPSDIPAEELVQPGCEDDEDCPGGFCIAGIGEGLCTAACTAQSDCPDGTVCTDTETNSGGVCLLESTDSSYCRDLLGPEYNCDTETNYTTDEDVRVCIDGA